MDDDLSEAPARTYPTQTLQLRCRACRRLLEAAVPIHCPFDLFARAMGGLRCPACASADLLMGQGRSLAEDRALATGSTYEERVASWPATGERGASAEAVHRHMTGRPAAEAPAPRDAHDVGTCMLLLDRVPEWRPRMAEMAAASAEWAALVPLWPELEAAFAADDASGPGRRATAAVLSRVGVPAA